MDLKAPVTYRGLDLNTTTRIPGGGISGTQLNAVDLSTVSGVGYSEKRALGDGRDASDVYLDARRIAMQGQVYGLTRAEVYDLMRQVAAIFNPVLAFDEDPVLQGFLPMTFHEPSGLAAFTPDGMDLLIYVRPIAQPSFQISRDLLGGADSKGGTILYQVVLEAKDPRLYVADPVYVAFVGTGATSALANRGDYASPLTIQLHVPAALGAGTVTVTLNGQTIVITVLDSAVDQDYVYDGAKKLLTLTKAGVTTLKMSLLATAHPKVNPGANTITWASTINLPAGAGLATSSFATFAEAFA
jgi:hypothetical protein